MRPEIRGLILGLTAALFGFPLMGWSFFLTHMVPDGHTDFRATYAAGYMLRTGKPLYDPAAQFEAQNQVVSREEIALPFNHPAYEALIYLPLSFLSYLHAYWLWFALNLLMLVGIYFVLRGELKPLTVVAPWLPIASLPAYLPFGAALVQGQDSILCTLLFACASVRMQDDRRIFAGFLLGLAAFRFQILLPVMVCFLCWRQWQTVGGVLCSAIPAAGISGLLGGVRPYVTMLLRYSGQGAANGMVDRRTLEALVSHMPNLRGLIQSSGGGSWLVLLVSMLVLATACVAGQGRALREQLALAITVASLISYHGLVHDLSVLFIPCALVFSSGNIRALSTAGIVFFAPILLIFGASHFYLAAFGVLTLFVSLVASPFLSTTSGAYHPAV
jgi:hypothetical protein